MMSVDKPNIPSIVTEDLSATTPVINEVVLDDDPYTPAFPTSSSSNTGHSRSPSDPAFLSPVPILRTHDHRFSADSSSSRGSQVIFLSPESDDAPPPSPTLSTQSSIHFANSKALRDNKPETRDGLSSLNLLAPHYLGHGRKASSATSISATDDGTEADHSFPHLFPTSSNVPTLASPTPTHVGSNSDIGDDNTLHRDSVLNRDEGQKDDQAEHGAEDERQPSPLDLAQDENIDPTPFLFRPYSLASLVDPKNLDMLERIGGDIGLLRGLGTDSVHGLSQKAPAGAGEGASQRHERQTEPKADALPGIVVTSPTGDEQKPHDDENALHAKMEDRRLVYGENILPERHSKSLWSLMWLALKDKVLILLSIAAIVSLALGFFQDFGPARVPNTPPVDWVEGVSIVIAIFIVVMVGSLNDWQKERQFKALNEKKEERGVTVVRDGEETVIDIRDVVVGDIAILEPGEIIPCDGVFLSGHNVKCDESAATGESDSIKKAPYEDCIALRNQARHGGTAGGEGGLRVASAHTDCFLVSGSKVQEGYGKYVVIAVGTKSFNGRIMMALRGETENTPLQIKLNRLAEIIAQLGSLAGILLFTALMIRFFVQLGTNNPVRTANETGIAFVNIVIIAVTLVVVAVPEGLPLAVTLAMAFATKRMTEEGLLVRVLSSCETMANASIVCTDKTGTLTQNSMTVVAGSIGIHAKFVRNLKENKARTNAPDEHPEPTVEADIAGVNEIKEVSLVRRHMDDFSIDQTNINSILSPQLQKLFNEAIAINSTAFEDKNPETEELQFVGSKTETALLTFAKNLGWDDYRKIRESAHIVQMIPFSSRRKSMGVVVRISDHSNRYRIYLKGASEILTKLCSRHVVVSNGLNELPEVSSSEVETKMIDDVAMDNISRTIIFYSNQSFRTIALCYRDFESWPPAGTRSDSEDEIAYDNLAQDLTLIGITGIEDPLRDGVPDAVAVCTKAGVSIKMCTGDNAIAARSIAMQCGIYTAGGIIMEGPVFRQLGEKDRLEIIPRLQVLARSSPEDKKMLVEMLQSLGETVGVTGDGSNDGPALKIAHVGFSMGIAGTEVAKEASDIILMDDNFASIVKAIMWGRCVNDSVRKFLQFQISTNITAVIITFVSAIASNSETSVLTAVQLLWINLIMDTFAALALATDPASTSLLDRKPNPRNAPLFSVHMMKQILVQSIYQVTVVLVFHFIGNRILGFDNSTHSNQVVTTLVFNAFVFAQIFNSVNCRRLDTKLNVFEGVLRNWYFMLITLIEIAGQIIIVFVGGAAFQVTSINGREWGISLALGIVSIPLGALIRLMPSAPFEKLFITLRLLPNPEVLPTTRGEWNPAIEQVRDSLSMFANIRGGRVRASSFVGKSRTAKLRANNPAPISSMMAMVPTIIASSVGARWAPRHSLSDPAQNDPSKSSFALWEGKLQFHPDTKPDDPMFLKWGAAAAKAT